jgi:hypothetical protein
MEKFHYLQEKKSDIISLMYERMKSTMHTSKCVISMENILVFWSALTGTENYSTSSGLFGLDQNMLIWQGIPRGGTSYEIGLYCLFKNMSDLKILIKDGMGCSFTFKFQGHRFKFFPFNEEQIKKISSYLSSRVTRANV